MNTSSTSVLAPPWAVATRSWEPDEGGQDWFHDGPEHLVVAADGSGKVFVTAQRNEYRRNDGSVDVHDTVELNAINLSISEAKHVGHRLIATARLLESGVVDMGEPDAWDFDRDGTGYRWTNNDRDGYREAFEVASDDSPVRIKPQVFERLNPGTVVPTRTPMVTVGDYDGLSAENALALADELIRYATHLAETEAAR